MISLGTAIGFALVFVLTAWTMSALTWLLTSASGDALRRLGPAAERRVTALAAVLPVLVAASVVATLVIRSVTGDDHCQEHDHHAHLCLAHGDAWAGRSWAIALVASAAAIMLVRLLLFAGTLLRGWRAVAALRTASRRIGDVLVVESARPFCFVAGLHKPEIYASTAAWHGLDDEQRAAMLGHERSHVANRDLAWRAALEVVSVFGAPLTPSPVLARWEQATERLRDGDAARAVGSPEAVADALVRMCRLGASPAPAASAGFTPAPAALAERVEALIGDRPRGDRAATALGAIWLLVVAAIAVATVTHAEPLHHALESMLG